MQHTLFGLRVALAAVLWAALATAQDVAVFRFRPATEAEVTALSLRTGGALVVEAVPAAVTELKVGDVLAFADTTALLSLDDLKGAVKDAAGKSIDLLFYRGGKADLATVVLKPEMLVVAKPADLPVDKPVDQQVEKPGAKPPSKPPPQPVDPPSQPEKPAEPTRPTEPTQPAAVAIPATRFDPDGWTFMPRQATGAILAEGGMRLHYLRASTDAHTAMQRQRLHGDFELVVHYEMLDWQPTKLLSAGFGVRVESEQGWSGDRIVTLDRSGRRNSDRVVAGTAEKGDEELAIQPKTSGGFLRVRRSGDAFYFATREADSKADAWTDLGELKARLSPDVGLWLTSYGIRADEVRVLVRDVSIGKIPVGR